MVNQSDPHASGDTWTTYTSVPYFVTSEIRGLIVETSHVSFFDFTDPEIIDIEILGARYAEGRFFVGRDMFDLCEQYTGTVSGRMNVLPQWVGAAIVFLIPLRSLTVLLLVCKVANSKYCRKLTSLKRTV